MDFILIDWYGREKKCPQKIKCQLLEIKLFVSLEKFNETFHTFPIDNHFNGKYRKSIFSCNSFLGKTMKWFQMRIQNPVKHLRSLYLKKLYLFDRVWNTPMELAPKLFEKIMQLILLGHDRDNLDWNKI